jgi:hypothetical protein
MTKLQINTDCDNAYRSNWHLSHTTNSGALRYTQSTGAFKHRMHRGQMNKCTPLQESNTHTILSVVRVSNLVYIAKQTTQYNALAETDR